MDNCSPIIRLPSEAVGLWIVASVSGGKDSTALILALLEAVERGDIPIRMLRFVFADTGWEAAETYEYLDYLRRLLGIAIDVVRADLLSPVAGEDGDGPFAIDVGEMVFRGGMVDRIRAGGRFPGRMQRWCTRELKLEPLRKYHDHLIDETGIETVAAMGIRSEESEHRSKMPEWDDEPPGYRSWGGYVWRPLKHWTITEVLQIHNRHGVRVNPLYQRGHNRVGCYPCIFANKEEIALVAQHMPDRIDQIRYLESDVVALRQRRNEETPGRYKHVEDASFFQTKRQGFTGIDEVVAWARTDHGGRQLPLLPAPPRGGCMRWGICDMPAEPVPVADVPWSDPSADAPWACSECGYEQLDSDPCRACGSVRVVTTKVLKEIVGPAWREQFSGDGGKPGADRQSEPRATHKGATTPGQDTGDQATLDRAEPDPAAGNVSESHLGPGNVPAPRTRRLHLPPEED